ncbi:MAG: twin-arginine translocase subunit TatB [Gammaproteobacteria bacterium]|nr:twin-arginine translocase subunit TatB [Gammaproteobacteria bacterium]
MFDIGFWEMLLIGVVALVVIGPERLPAVARTLGSWTAKVRNFVAHTRADLEKELNTEEIRKMMDAKEGEINELRDMLNETRASIQEAKDQYVMHAIDDDSKADKDKPEEAKTEDKASDEETPDKDSVKGGDGKS